VPITATNGQSGGFTVTDIVPLCFNKRRVLYIGDYELRGPADQIEQNTKRYIEKHTGRTLAEDEWIKIALTDKQVKANPRLNRLTISKLDKRNKPAKPYKAIECDSASTSTACCRSRLKSSANAKRNSERPCLPHSASWRSKRPE
jgi:hypothetical protein